MKKLFSLAALAILSLASTAFAIDLTTVDGKTYKDADITKLTPIGLKFICNGQSGWINFRDLTPDMQKSFGYDPAAAAAFEQKLVDNKGFTTVTQPAPKAAPSASSQTQAQQTPQEPETQDALIAQQTPPDLSAYPPDAQPVSQPPPGATVIDCSNGIPDTLNSAEYLAGPAYCSNSYVLWGGCYYPAYYWNHWWNDHHWTWHDGHYYPLSYYNHHGVWENGKYYPYHHGRLYESEPWKNADHDRERFQNQYHQSHGNVSPHSNFGGSHYHGGGGRR